ncbi:hypothetical protein BGZ70_008117 [Mortierella alpina]|uniref:Uncharacterized protein n=1 Tax=Mortierella alpina TaxID=64518 RepID=A0A9P6M602_MORAP|nr:hypothetical protein BGZ70_008117 [Mortierella alpina]
MSCLAVAPNHDHFDHPSFSNRLYDTIEISEDGVATTAFTTGAPGSSASPVQTRHVSRKSDGNISISQLQKSLSGAGISNAAASEASASGGEGADGVVSVATGSLGGKLVKLNPTAPIPRRSLLSDMLNNQSQSGANRLEQNAHRRRMLKSMRRYSVDASEMNFNALALYPSGRASPMKSIPSEEGEESAAATNGSSTRGAQDFTDTPTVRYLRNPCHATVKTRLVQGGARRGAGEDGESRDYFGADDRVW